MSSQMSIEQISAKIDFMEKQMKLIMAYRNNIKPSDNQNPIKKKTTRHPSGYNLYCKANRDEAKEAIIEEEDLAEDEKISNKKIMSKLGEMWKNEPSKQEWVDKALSLKNKLDNDSDSE